jgi:apolipoprotein N-acyltransferase
MLSSRGLSILAALVADIALAWLLLVHKAFSPDAGQIEGFWLPILIGFAAYAILQMWTLATVTSTGDDFAAAIDKLVSLSPLLLVLIVEVFWVARGEALTWRYHVVALLVGLYAITDYFSTDITNQRLRSRQIGLGSPGP